MSMKRKTRDLPFGSGYSSGEVDRWNSSTLRWDSLTKNSVSATSYIGNQVTDSESHQWPPPQGSHGDVGGDFFTKKMHGSKRSSLHVQKVEVPITQGPYTKQRFKYRFDLSCPIELNAQNKPKWPTAQNSSPSSLTALGAKAISLCKPTNSGVELSVALGEIFRDGLPAVAGAHTWQEKTLRARNAGDEYLNVQFGWLPLVDDISSLGRTIANSDRIMKQYDADRGKSIRRQYEFPVEESSTGEILSYTKSPDGICIDSNIGPSSIQGVWSKKTTTRKRRWFSGAFVYGAPLGVTAKEKSASLAEKADRLFGLSLTPDVIWNLTPWSWATDWVLNTGDVLSNLSDFISQGLVMQYGYLMEHTIVKVEYSLTGASFHGQPVNVPDSTLVVETKSRTRANPFGFGITWDGLSSTQAAILAALGISRS